MPGTLSKYMAEIKFSVRNALVPSLMSLSVFSFVLSRYFVRIFFSTVRLSAIALSLERNTTKYLDSSK